MEFELEDSEYHISRRTQFARQKQLIWILSLTGLVPFLACAIILTVMGTTNPLAEPSIAIFRNYSVVILSFLGGIRWGHALLRTHDETSDPDLKSILLSVIPALVAWSTIFLPDTLALALLLLAFCLQGVWDSFSAHLGSLPKWFGSVRITLTAIVAASHMVVILLLA